MIWTEALDAILIEHYHKGLSFRQIACVMHDVACVDLSRNACIGRAARLKLPSRPGCSKSPTKPKAEKRFIPRQWVSAGRPTGAIMESKFLGVSFAELEEWMCHFPDDGKPARYCGQPRRKDSPYCVHCHDKVYLKRTA